MIRFTVCAWNVRRRQQAYAYLDDHLRPDVALLQETRPPGRRTHTIYRPIGGNRDWGSAITSRWPVTEITHAKSPYSKTPAALQRSHPGCMAIGEVTPDSLRPVIVVSIYGLIQDGYAHSTMHRLLSDLTPLLDGHRKARLLLGGDLNLSTQLAEPHARHHRPAFERLAAFGLIDLLAHTAPERTPLPGCPCRDTVCTHVQTYRHSRGTTPWQNDYLYATKALADELVNCQPISGDPDDPWQISDHRPVLATFDLSA